MKFVVFFISFFFFLSLSHAQQIKVLTDSGKISLRGLSVVNDSIIWASGSSGKVVRSVNGGNVFEWITVEGYGQRDFRDVEAFDANTALIMAVDTPAIILKTIDGGKTWKEVFYDNRKGMFLDAMDFDDKGTGLVIGDPINGNLFKATSVDNGNTWLTLNIADSSYGLNEGEAFFAASGTNIKMTRNKNCPTIAVTGGTKSRLMYADKFYPLDIVQGKETTGANSIDVYDKNAVIVGGDFNKDTSAFKNCVLVELKKNPEFKLSQTPPHGYRSCVTYITKDKLITCGTSGVDISNDGGLNWQLISNESYHVCAKAKKGNAVFLAGKNGRIARLD